MVLPYEMSIKQEKEDYESESTEYLSPEFEVALKVEVECSHVTTYEVKTEFESSDEKPCLSSYFDVPVETYNGVDFEDLIEYIRVQCGICDKLFLDRYSFLQHNLNHLKLKIDPVIQCQFCLKHFTKKYFPTHIELNHNNQVLEEPINIKPSEMLHQCKHCGKILTYKTMHSHIKEVHGSAIFKCDNCNAVFKCKKYLRNHIRAVHMSPELCQCGLCLAVLKCKNALKTHMRNCHSEKAQCHLCKSVLKSQSYLNTHMRRVHYNDGKVHKCFCGKSFQSPRYLKVHKKNAHLR